MTNNYEPNVELALPNPKNLIHSLRDIGYSLETAIADVIDNSISAGASEVRITISYEEQSSFIAILDNGKGMNENELRRAMNLGSFNPSMERNTGDLGRFGLGLKTASFSQAGKLTVVSLKDDSLSCRVWDLDHVFSSQKWELVVPNREDLSDIPEFNSLTSNGTLVLWQDLYRLIEGKSKKDPEDLFWEKVDLVRQHLSMVFHRYLSGEPGLDRIKILINNDSLVPFNPFEGAGKPFPQEVFHGVKMQAYLLPHHSKTPPEQYKRMAGLDGYLKSQGFYVYRNARLLISGTWFRLLRQSESTKLARVQIDLPNTEDFNWSIDVKKSHAVPPEPVREQLKRTIEKISSQSSRVYTKRGKRIVTSGVVPIWQEQHSHGKKSYKVNTDNPLIKKLTSQLNDKEKSDLKAVIDLIENGLPIDTIYADMSKEPEVVQQDQVTDELLKKSAEVYWSMMVGAGVSESDIVKRMLLNEPFSNHPEFSKQFIDTRTGINNG